MNDRSLQIGDRISWKEKRGGESFASFTPDIRHERVALPTNRMFVEQEGVELPRLLQEVAGSWFAYHGQDGFILPVVKAPE